MKARVGKRLASVGLAALVLSGSAASGQNPLITGKHLTLPPLGAQREVGSIYAGPGEFAAGLALDGRGYLYVANNDTAFFSIPGSLAVYHAATGRQMGRFTFGQSAPSAVNFPFAVAALADGSRVYVS